MSGGVDSSVAAARLVKAGEYDEVVGVTLHLWDYPDDGSVKGRCCAPEDIHDARRVCDFLGIPYYAFDRRELFEREVVTPFVESYLGGTTPSPCVRCNRGVKIRELLSIADRLGAERIATGHYARIDADKRRLLRALDRGKDQSYFLHMFGPEVLGRLVFPLGSATKQEVRDEAVSLALPGATKGESQELCFVPTGRYDAFVDGRSDGRQKGGAILDVQGNKLADHDGIHRFTVGQRRNLGVAVGERAYVVSLDAESGDVQLGPRDRLARRDAIVTDLALGADVRLPFECEVAVRYRGATTRARVEAAPEGARVRFDEDVYAVVPGQVAVFYRGDEVLGGGVIAASPEDQGQRRLPLLQPSP